jgi:chaperonin cofactor prefoldin/cell division protein FtsB
MTTDGNEQYDQPPKPKSNLLQYVLMAVISIIVVIALSYLGVTGVTKNNFNQLNVALSDSIATVQTDVQTVKDGLTSTTAQINTLNTQLTKASSDVTTLKTDLSKYALLTALDGYVKNSALSGYATNTAVNTALVNYAKLSDVDTANNNVKTMQTQLANDEKTIKTLQDSLASLTASYTTINSSLGKYALKDTYDASIAKLQKDVADIQASLKTVNDNITSMQTSIKSLSTLLTQSNTDVAQLKTDVAKLKTDLSTLQTVVANQITTTPPATTTTTTTGTVFASILPNAFTGSTRMDFPTMGVSTTQNRSFVININDSLTKPITKVQLAIGFQMTDTNNNVSDGLPTGASVSLVTSGMAVSWVQQSTGMPSVIGFINTVPTGLFADMGIISQGVGLSSYNFTIYITTGTTKPINNPFYLYPTVKVIGYS